jgi:hypothetical protein
MDHAYSLSAQALVASWPLPHGALLIPRILSDTTAAPFIGETALLFIFLPGSQNPTSITPAPNTPLIVFLGLSVYLAGGALLLGIAK